jgi:nicotinate (nicotinamide) nucleotide adenylyltransferase
MKKKRSILIFGGSFSPPTLAHEEILRQCLGLPGFDEIWAMPSGDRLDKTIPAEDKHRLAMLAIVKAERLANDPRLHISSFELEMSQPTSTFGTLHSLRTKFPQYDFWFAFGRDSYFTMPSWPHGAELRRSLSMVLFGDPDGPIPEGSNIVYVVLPSTFSQMSATQARQALASGENLSSLVSKPIARYLQRFTSESLFQ